MKERDPNSHKGDHGIVLVVGGNEVFHGAPILAALGAEHSGADLVLPFVPYHHAELTRGYSLNFIVNNFEKSHLSSKDTRHILTFSKKSDVVVLGPGLGNAAETVTAVKALFKKIQKPMVIDASALMYSANFPEGSVLTPHRSEFKDLTGEEPTEKNVQKWARDLKVTILVKGPKDIIASADELISCKTGNALMTVGGTGDVLAGFIGGLMAQGYASVDACQIATSTLGNIAETIAESQSSLRAHEMAKLIPAFMHLDTSE